MPASLQTVVILAIAMLGLPTTNARLTAYDCSSVPRFNLFTVGYSSFSSCDIRQLRTIPSRLVERPGPKTVVGYRCLVNEVHRPRIYGLYSYEQLYGSYKPQYTLERISRDACLKAHENKVMELHGSLSSHLDLNEPVSLEIQPPRTITSSSSWSYTPLGAVSTREYKIILSVHSGTVDFEGDIVSFDLGVDCDFSNYTCDDDHFGQIFWTSEFQSGLNHTDLFSGEITLLLLDTQTNLNYALINVEGSKYVPLKVHNLNHLNKTEVLSRKNAFWVEHSDWFIDVSNVSFPYAGQLDRFNDSENIYPESSLESEKARILANWCRGERVNPNYWSNGISIGEWLDSPEGKFSSEKTIVGRIWRTRECLRTLVSRRRTDKCSDEIPVKYEQRYDYKNMFLRRFSRILVDTAGTHSCPTEQQSESTSESPILVEQAQTIAAPTESTDSVKIVLILIVSFWGLATLVRLSTIIYYVYTAQKDSQVKSPTQEKRLITLENVYEVLKPPFLGKYPESWKQNVTPEIVPSAPTAKHCSEEDENLYESI